MINDGFVVRFTFIYYNRNSVYVQDHLNWKKNEVPFVAIKNHSCVDVKHIHSNTTSSSSFYISYAYM